MALSAAVLKTALKTALVDDAGAQDNDATDALAEAIATAVVDHIVSAAVVTVAAGIPTSAPAVTTGPGLGTIA